jgi:hypothetical protein
MSSVYWTDAPLSWGKVVRHVHYTMAKSHHFFVSRAKPYDPRGRRQSEQSARGLDDMILDEIHDAGVDCFHIDGSPTGAAVAAQMVFNRLKREATTCSP